MPGLLTLSFSVLLVGATTLGTTAGAAPAKAAAGSSCVACHRTVTGGEAVQHTYQDWATSRHATAGVGCEGCHGGDPTAKDKDKAHAGVLPSGDAASAVYFTRIPETCGKCHPGELNAFRQSRHFAELQTSGRGPNCVTCHGAMAGHILDPHSLDQVCTVCHRRPTQAYAGLLSLNHATDQLKRLKAALGKAGRADAAAQAKEYEALAKLKDGLAADWHTFNMPEVIRVSQEISHRAGAAVNELSLKRGGGAR